MRNPTTSILVENLGGWFKLRRIENPECKHPYCPLCSPNKRLREYEERSTREARAIKPDFYTPDEDCIHQEACALCWMDRRLGIADVREGA